DRHALLVDAPLRLGLARAERGDDAGRGGGSSPEQHGAAVDDFGLLSHVRISPNFRGATRARCAGTHNPGVTAANAGATESNARASRCRTPSSAAPYRAARATRRAARHFASGNR